MLVRAFGDAARRCREGGLDGVELSFAHNHLVDQFWSPLFNRRTDDYGGSLDNRLRSSITEGVVVFLSLFDDNPLVHDTFCPPRSAYAGDIKPGARRPLPPLE